MGKALKKRATVICQRGDKILFVRKAKAKWKLPGGRIEADEGPGQAALRELNEETGLQAVQLHYIAPLELQETLHYLFATAAHPQQQAVPSNEIADCCWIAPQDLAGYKVNKATRQLLRSYLNAH